MKTMCIYERNRGLGDCAGRIEKVKAAIDLPLKALVAEDAEGKVSVTYNDPEYLRVRHGVPAELIKNLAGAGALIAKAVE